MFSYETLHQQQMDAITRLRLEVQNWLHIADIRTSLHGEAVLFIGKLADNAEAAYNELRDRFRNLGYTALLRRDGDTDIVVAQRGVNGLSRSNPWINLVLFLATVLTTLFAGAGLAGVNWGQLFRAGEIAGMLGGLAAGAPFALTLLFILGVHEMGHYVAARLHGAQVTLPYFIPVPFGLGTFGAFIQMKSPIENRKVLFDVGLAGPLAGFVVALPLMALGLLLSNVVTTSGVSPLGSSILLTWLMDWLVPHTAGQAVALHPIAIAAWFGLLVTAINLLPMGQLDGGHIAYALLGKYAQPLAWAVCGTLLFLGVTVWSGWLTWAILAFFFGLNHNGPLNDITPLDGKRKVLGLLTLVLFALIFTVKPF